MQETEFLSLKYLSGAVIILLIYDMISNFHILQWLWLADLTCQFSHIMMSNSFKQSLFRYIPVIVLSTFIVFKLV